MRKLKAMAEDAAAEQAKHPATDTNVWNTLMLCLAAGVSAVYPDNESHQRGAMQTFYVAIKDGLKPEARRALDLAERLQLTLNKAQGSEQG